MLKVHNLTRNFGDIEAVKNISFQVNKGDILGFIGVNGAGKSTTMRLLTGYLTPNEGEIYLEDKLLNQNELLCKSLIGYLPECAPMYGDMTVKSFLLFCAELRKLKNKNDAFDDVVEKCSLQEVVYRKIMTLSKGYRQRVCFAQSIIHQPDLLILDEPTDGLDPRQKNEMRQIIRNFGKDKAIILSTHILEEVDLLSTHILLIHKGEICVNEDSKSFKKRNGIFSRDFFTVD